ncbi:MAG: 1,4-dihydroxy-2-naphthoate octaprenyltransferase [Anaerolineae bacterium]|nr:1,4-dihydroxy-2-naphthoate octaprenyltransferase [Anaerolineae bacterium]
MTLLEANPRLLAWYRASRPRTLTATYAPLGLAAVIALDAGVFHAGYFVLSLVGALLLQIAANLINEYADFRRGADARKEAGQGMIIKHAVLTPREVLIGAILTTLGGVLIGLYLLAHSGPLLLWIGLGGVLVVILYTAGPFPLAYHGLGELTVFVFMGPLMILGAYYVMAGGQVSETALLAGIPVGFMVAAIMHANNIRDIEADRAASKHTLAARFGLRFARGFYVFLVGGAYVATGAMILAGVMPWPVLLVGVTLPEAYRLIVLFSTQTEVAPLHQGQGRTARLHGQFGLWLVIGWLLALALEWLAR